MGVTPTDLYRIGDATGPGLDRLRAGLDVVTFLNGSDVWVKGTPLGGASTTAKPWRLRSRTSRWWHLPVGSSYAPDLVVRNDHGSHWLWEPAADMPWSQFVSLLDATNADFR
jgi:hypothetical protein